MSNHIILSVLSNGHPKIKETSNLFPKSSNGDFPNIIFKQSPQVPRSRNNHSFSNSPIYFRGISYVFICEQYVKAWGGRGKWQTQETDLWNFPAEPAEGRSGILDHWGDTRLLI